MAGMKRFIAYIYGYENAKKAGNTGFARIELRGEECRLEIHLRSVYAAQTHCRVYLFRKQGNQMEGSLIGEMDVRNGAGDFATAMKIMHIPTSSLSFFEMDGIFLCSEDGRIFMSRWTEEPLTVDMEHFGSGEKASQRNRRWKKRCIQKKTCIKEKICMQEKMCIKRKISYQKQKTSLCQVKHLCRTV